ncbi:hypothetical protein [Paenibacillus abyssi]|uniref:Uncharacterized protein n=1 Tax=Paenibacillus abyssi TaxID=1340531 RepID=A0A917LFI8_9BACL|nr:hypothetical protein [Paenibacillus abyssi]GGG18302.1 hypothetical protein GCM10010916_38930 [Paenibacillus abyssi]
MENNMEQKEQGLFSENAVVVEAVQPDHFEMTIGKDGQLSLFGTEPEAPAASEEEKGKGKPASATKAAGRIGKAPKTSTPVTPAKPKIEKVPLNEPDSWKVRLYGQTYIINVLFEEEIADGKIKATLEEIREKLATVEGHVELTHARTKYDADEPNKLLFVDCFGTEKGAS